MMIDDDDDDDEKKSKNDAIDHDDLRRIRITRMIILKILTITVITIIIMKIKTIINLKTTMIKKNDNLKKVRAINMGGVSLKLVFDHCFSDFIASLNAATIIINSNCLYRKQT